MVIQRAISHGAHWALALDHIPALFELIDEQQIPVDICRLQGAGTVALHTGLVCCRRHEDVVILEASGTSIKIDLKRVKEARAVSCAAGSRRRISVQLIAESGAVWLVITGPAVADSHAGQVWQLVLDSLRVRTGCCEQPKTTSEQRQVLFLEAC